MTTPAPTAPPAWTLQGIGRSLGVACFAIAVGGGVGYLISHERPPRSKDDDAGKDMGPPRAPAPPAPPSAGMSEMALLTPLRVGHDLGGFTVTEIHPVSDDGLLRIVCRKGATVVKLDVALSVDAGPAPPAVAGKYAVFYGTEGPATPAEGEALALALAAVIDANAAAPVPRGLAPFVPGQH